MQSKAPVGAKEEERMVAAPSSGLKSLCRR